MAKVYFAKELVGNSYFVNGKAVPFEVLDGNRGVIALEANDPLVAALNVASEKHRGGVYRISEAEYHEKKNHFPFNPSAQPQKERLQVLRAPNPFNPFPGANRGAATPAVNAKPGAAPTPAPAALPAAPAEPQNPKITHLLSRASSRASARANRAATAPAPVPTLAPAPAPVAAPALVTAATPPQP